ncbi:unnamed protein product [Adineta steineri]|uniref:Uncharacterized protein n=1 Tax=Adineta steineri TaxID=433720 RepID=A0A818QAD1_9BILA|nr:unnamed protein product [Adineta steineri]
MCSYTCYKLLILFLTYYQINTQYIPFDTIVSFGDSNSDTGNVYSLTHQIWPIVPPYYRGRFTNGPVWIEKLGVSDIKNYAYGGATTDNNLVQGYTAGGVQVVPGVRQQILIYINQTNKNEINFERTLYIIWAGANDFYFNKLLKPSLVADSNVNRVKELLKFGAKHLLIVNQQPVHALPSNLTEKDIAHLKQRTIYYNNNLSAGITKLNYNHNEISIYLFDVYSLILNIIDNKSNYSLTSMENCWNIVNGKIITLCSNPESYFYIDQYHFTTRLHELIGNAARQFIRTSSTITHLPSFIYIILCTLITFELSSSS